MLCISIFAHFFLVNKILVMLTNSRDQHQARVWITVSSHMFASHERIA